MGGECILITFIAGWVPFFYGFWICASGRVYLSSTSDEPLRGWKAKFLGLMTILCSIAYFVVFFWAWSKYDR
jgi:hypothetical protein